MGAQHQVRPRTGLAPPTGATRAVELCWGMEAAVLLYDGKCGLCRAGSAWLVEMARPGAVQRMPMQSERGRRLMEESGISSEAAQAAMHLVVWDGRGAAGVKDEIKNGAKVYAGPDAAAVALATRTLLRWLPWAARLPVIRWMVARVYQWIAERRYRLSELAGAVRSGKVEQAGERAAERQPRCSCGEHRS